MSPSRGEDTIWSELLWWAEERACIWLLFGMKQEEVSTEGGECLHSESAVQIPSLLFIGTHPSTPCTEAEELSSLSLSHVRYLTHLSVIEKVCQERPLNISTTCHFSLEQLIEGLL